jgi:glycosyltransferase involved in cell wall biosynthesis
MSRRLRICYLVPGHGLLATAGPTRNVLSLAKALGRHAEVEVAFRSLIDPVLPDGLRVVEIEAGALDPGAARDDAATRGVGYGELLRYLRRLRRFVAANAGRFDVILEKSWLFSGWLGLEAERHGMLGVAVENVVPSPRRHAEAGMMKQLRVLGGRWWAGRCLRRSRLVIAETEQLKEDIVRVWRVPAERVAVVGLGVDRELFHPIDQAAARAALCVPPKRTVLLYVGALDETHDLGPAIAAVAALDGGEIELRIVGDGPSRAAFLARAGSSPRIVFCGRIPHSEVARHIAVADLCLAPYDSRAFAGGALVYSTMKIPEYLSVGRAVVAAPSARARELIEDQVTGFLLLNEPRSWSDFLAALPPRERLAAMGRAALERPQPSWDDTAEGYLAAIERARARRGRP